MKAIAIPNYPEVLAEQQNSKNQLQPENPISSAGEMKLDRRKSRRNLLIFSLVYAAVLVTIFEIIF